METNALDKWFLENENCTYKEFCDIYNGGNKDLSEIQFINIPEELKIQTIEIKLHPLFEKFLILKGIKEEWLKNNLKTFKGKELLRFIKQQLNNDPNSLKCSSLYITYWFSDYKTSLLPPSSERIKWNNYQYEWDKYVEKNRIPKQS